MIRTRRSEKKKLEDEAMRLRAEADSAAILGQSGMQLHGMGNNSRRLLEEGRLRKNVKMILADNTFYSGEKNEGGHDQRARGC